MDDKQITKFKESINNMRAKVIAAKGKSVEGLSPITISKPKHAVVSNKVRETNS